jgi:subtilase family serine protease
MLALSLTAVSSLTASASQPRLRVAGAAAVPARATVMTGNHQVTFDVVLSSKDSAGEASFLRALTTPGTAQYRHFLTPTQFAHRFGAPEVQVDAVRRYFVQHGLRVGSLSRGRLVLALSGPRSAVARAFQARVVTIKDHGIISSQFASTATLPADLAHAIVGVEGLSSPTPRSSNLVTSHATGAYTPNCPSAGSANAKVPSSLGGYTAGQEGSLYGLSSQWAKGNTGQGSVIALYELGSYDAADLTTYFACYGLSPTINAIKVDGGSTGAYSDEATIDIEQAGVLAPGATLDVYSGPNTSAGPTDVYTRIADDNLATVVSVSWGDCETDPTGAIATERPLFEQMAAEGITVVAAAGDSGSSDCHGVTNNGLAVDDPASQPFVTGVGGLTVSSISPLNQSVWNSGSGSGASGGGVSALWSRPWWQTGALFTGDTSQGVATAKGRMVPDLSVLGDPSTGFMQYFTGTNGTGVSCGQNGCASGWSSIGGTSIGAPLVSALFAIANQVCGTTRLGFMNPTLYEIATTAGNYVDVTSGTNDVFQNGAYGAGVGYDLASGLGSPSSSFINNLCPPAISLAKSSTQSSVATTAYLGHSVTLATTLRDVNGFPVPNATVTFHATSTQGNVVFDGDPSTAQGANGSTVTATTSVQGVATVTLSASVAQLATISASVSTGQISSTPISFVIFPYALRLPWQPVLTLPVPQSTSVALSIKATPSPHPPITAYEVTTNGGKTWTMERASVRRFRLKGLLPAQTYLIAIRAVNHNGVGPYSLPLRVTTSV